MIYGVYQVFKLDGMAISFSLNRICEAINRAYQDERKVEREIEEFMWLYPDAEPDYYYYLILQSMKERRNKAKKRRIKLICQMNAIIKGLWFKRNAGAGRSNTSAVSDKMLLTVPTPPTAATAICSLRRGGAICANLG